MTKEFEITNFQDYGLIQTPDLDDVLQPNSKTIHIQFPHGSSERKCFSAYIEHFWKFKFSEVQVREEIMSSVEGFVKLFSIQIYPKIGI